MGDTGNDFGKESENQRSSAGRPGSATGRIYEKLHVRSRAQAVAKYAPIPRSNSHYGARTLVRFNWRL
jgi:hypothetical protein